MPFQMIHQDITKMKTDAIVNAANSHLLAGGGVCGAIFEAAGRDKLQAECDQKAPCPVGKAVITKGYELKAKYVIHAVGPIWRGGKAGEEALLRSAYTESLKLAKEKGCRSIAFPLISAGIYGYPKKQALETAVSAIKAFLEENEMMVYLVIFDRQAAVLSEQLYHSLEHYIDTYYEGNESRKVRQEEFMQQSCEQRAFLAGGLIQAPERLKETTAFSKTAKDKELDSLLGHMEESFSEYLLKLIDAKKMTDVEVYKKANMDRKLFSKIRSQKAYHPKKQTVLSLAVALKLTIEETEELLLKAGYSLSNSYKFDVIIRYFLEQEEYDVFKINEALFCYDEPLLGA